MLINKSFQTCLNSGAGVLWKGCVSFGLQRETRCGGCVPTLQQHRRKQQVTLLGGKRRCLVTPGCFKGARHLATLVGELSTFIPGELGAPGQRLGALVVDIWFISK